VGDWEKAVKQIFGLNIFQKKNEILHSLWSFRMTLIVGARPAAKWRNSTQWTLRQAKLARDPSVLRVSG
jgi:hypothetical protein